jgi:transketolase
MISMASGLALSGMIPVVHTIAPFLVERAFEMLKIDFGYQGLGGNFISVGGSYDYASLGCTHHCPGDVAILKTIPNMDIFVPGHPEEFDHDFRTNYYTDRPKYWRLSERCNSESYLDTVIEIQIGYCGTVYAVGPMLDVVVDACKELDVTIWHTRTFTKFDYEGSRDDILVVPFYEHSLPWNGLQIGVPREFRHNYGSVAEHDKACGLTALQIRKRIMDYFNL